MHQEPIVDLVCNQPLQTIASALPFCSAEALVARQEQALATAGRARADEVGVTLLHWSKPEGPNASQASQEPALAHEAPGAVISLALMQASYRRCDLSAYPDLEQALVSPASVFATPDEVVRHPLLSLTCKREILWRWAWDEHLIEVAQSEGMPDGPPSQLEQVKTALQALGREWSPDPAAPAMPIQTVAREETDLAA